MRPPAAPRKPARRRGTRWTPGKVVLALVAYVIAMIFLLPYAEMVISALRPPKELLDRGYLPHHFDWSNFTSIWKTGFGKNLGASLKIAGGATVLVLLVAMPAAYYTARHRFRGRTLFLLLVLATQMFQPAAMLVGVQREFIEFQPAQPDHLADPRQRRLQPRVRGVDPQRLLLVDPGRARGGRDGRRHEPARRARAGSRCRWPGPAS